MTADDEPDGRSGRQPLGEGGGTCEIPAIMDAMTGTCSMPDTKTAVPTRPMPDAIVGERLGFDGKRLDTGIEQVQAAPARAGFVGGNPRPAKMLLESRIERVFCGASREGHWGWDGACLETVSAIAHDPISYRGKDFNLYRYVGNSPIRRTDPTGLQAGAGTISQAQLDYAKSKCKAQCCGDNPWKSTKIFFQSLGNFCCYRGWTSSTRDDLLDQMHNIYNEANQFATAAIKELGAADTERNHAALRHCYASGKYAKLLGAGCAACLGHYREEYQMLHEGQSLETAQRVDWNNSMGRACAGAFGVGNTFGFGYSGPASDDKIKECCKQKFKDG